MRTQMHSGCLSSARRASLSHALSQSAGLVHCAWKIFISWLVHMRARNMKNCTNVQKMLQNYMTWGGGKSGDVWMATRKRGPGRKHLHIKYDNCGAKCYIWKVFLGRSPYPNFLLFSTLLTPKVTLHTQSIGHACVQVFGI